VPVLRASGKAFSGNLVKQPVTSHVTYLSWLLPQEYANIVRQTGI
jgi:hypothetical protein